MADATAGLGEAILYPHIRGAARDVLANDVQSLESDRQRAFNMYLNTLQDDLQAQNAEKKLFQDNILKLGSAGKMRPELQQEYSQEYKDTMDWIAQQRQAGKNPYKSGSAENNELVNRMNKLNMWGKIGADDYDYFVDASKKVDGEKYHIEDYNEFLSKGKDLHLKDYDITKRPVLEKAFDWGDYVKKHKSLYGEKDKISSVSSSKVPGKYDITKETNVEFEPFKKGIMNDKRAIDRLDKDFNTMLEPVEQKKYLEKIANSNISLFDADKDGKLNKDEIDNARREMQINDLWKGLGKSEVTVASDGISDKGADKKAFTQSHNGDISVNGFTFTNVPKEEIGKLDLGGGKSIAFEKVYRPETSSTSPIPKEITIESGFFKGKKVKPDLVAKGEDGKFYGQGFIDRKIPIDPADPDAGFTTEQTKIVYPITETQFKAAFSGEHPVDLNKMFPAAAHQDAPKTNKYDKYKRK